MSCMNVSMDQVWADDSVKRQAHMHRRHQGGYVVAVVDIIQCAGNYGRTLFLVAFSGALKIAKQTEDDEPIVLEFNVQDQAYSMQSVQD